MHESDLNNINVDLAKLKKYKSTKEKFSYLSMKVFGENDAEHISKIHKMFLQSWTKKKDNSYAKIEKILKQIIDKT